MDQITKFYINRANVLQEKLNNLQKQLNEAAPVAEPTAATRVGAWKSSVDPQVNAPEGRGKKDYSNMTAEELAKLSSGDSGALIELKRREEDGDDEAKAQRDILMGRNTAKTQSANSKNKNDIPSAANLIVATAKKAAEGGLETAVDIAIPNLDWTGAAQTALYLRGLGVLPPRLRPSGPPSFEMQTNPKNWYERLTRPGGLLSVYKPIETTSNAAGEEMTTGGYGSKHLRPARNIIPGVNVKMPFDLYQNWQETKVSGQRAADIIKQEEAAKAAEQAKKAADEAAAKAAQQQAAQQQAAAKAAKDAQDAINAAEAEKVAQEGGRKATRAVVDLIRDRATMPADDIRRLATPAERAGEVKAIEDVMARSHPGAQVRPGVAQRYVTMPMTIGLFPPLTPEVLEAGKAGAKDIFMTGKDVAKKVARGAGNVAAALDPVAAAASEGMGALAAPMGAEIALGAALAPLAVGAFTQTAGDQMGDFIAGFAPGEFEKWQEEQKKSRARSVQSFIDRPYDPTASRAARRQQ